MALDRPRGQEKASGKKVTVRTGYEAGICRHGPARRAIPITTPRRVTSRSASSVGYWRCAAVKQDSIHPSSPSPSRFHEEPGPVRAALAPPPSDEPASPAGLKRRACSVPRGMVAWCPDRKLKRNRLLARASSGAEAEPAWTCGGAAVCVARTTRRRPSPRSIEWLKPPRARGAASPSRRWARPGGAPRVDRLDDTRGIEERLLAVEEVLLREPKLRGRLTFVQLTAPAPPGPLGTGKDGEGVGGLAR